MLQLYSAKAQKNESTKPGAYCNTPCYRASIVPRFLALALLLFYAIALWQSGTEQGINSFNDSINIIKWTG
jgi:hypothetical protein